MDQRHFSAGCPCNPEADPDRGRCPAGWQCTELGFQQMEAAGGLWPPSGHLNATCVPCSFGQFCPEGTYQPAADSHQAIAEYVAKHTCRYALFSTCLRDPQVSCLQRGHHASSDQAVSGRGGCQASLLMVSTDSSRECNNLLHRGSCHCFC